MSEQFLLRLSGFTSFLLDEEAKKSGTSKTKLIEEIIDEYFSPGGLEVVLVGPPGKSSATYELMELLRRPDGRHVLGVVRVVSPIKNEEGSYLISYGAVLSDVVYAAVGCVDTRSIEGYNTYRKFEDLLDSLEIESVTVQGPRLVRILPEDAVKHVPTSALSRAFYWGKLLLLGGPNFSWEERHLHEAQFGKEAYVIVCKYPNPETNSEKVINIGYFYVFRKSIWSQELLLSNWAEGRCVVSFQKRYEIAQIEEFNLCWMKQNHWNTGLAEALLETIERHCAEIGCKIIKTRSGAFLEDEYSTYAVPVLTMKGYQFKEHELEKALPVVKPPEKTWKDRNIVIYCSKIGSEGVTKFALELISLAETLKDRIVGAIRLDYKNEYGKKFTYALIVKPARETGGYYWVTYSSRSTSDYSGEGGSGHERMEAILNELSIPLRSVEVDTEDCDEESILIEEAKKMLENR